MKKILLLLPISIFIVSCMGTASYYKYLQPDGLSRMIIKCPREHKDWCMNTIKRKCPDGYDFIDLSRQNNSNLLLCHPDNIFPAIYLCDDEDSGKPQQWEADIGCGKLD